MKIRDLFENTEYSKIDFFITLTTLVNLNSRQRKEMISKVNKIKFPGKCECVIVEDTIDITVVNLNQFNRAHLEDVNDIVHETLLELIEDMNHEIERGHNYIKCYGLPTKPIEYDEVNVYFTQDLIIPEIKNLDSVDNIYFMQCEHVKGGILNFLKLHADAVTWEGGGKTTEWSKVLMKHYKQNDSDIFSAKEDLINVGLKDYAKL